jgi:hypothetical protein
MSIKAEDNFSPIIFNDENERRIGFEQYKILIESINKSNDVRELSNSYWITVNALGVSAAAYIKDAQTLAQNHKPLVLWFIIILGIALCLSWLSFLVTINKNIEIRNNLVIEIEKYLPCKVFTRSIFLSGRQKRKGSLTINP